MAKITERALLNECVYALAEAMTNAECAATLEKRPDIKQQFEEDYIYLSELRKKIVLHLDNYRDRKRGIKA